MKINQRDYLDTHHFFIRRQWAVYPDWKTLDEENSWKHRLLHYTKNEVFH